MEKPKTKTKRQRPLKGHCVLGQVRVLQFPDRLAAVSLDEWQHYQQLASELERAECVVHNIRQRIQAVTRHLRRRIEDQHSPKSGQVNTKLASATMSVADIAPALFTADGSVASSGEFVGSGDSPASNRAAYRASGSKHRASRNRRC